MCFKCWNLSVFVKHSLASEILVASESRWWVRLNKIDYKLNFPVSSLKRNDVPCPLIGDKEARLSDKVLHRRATQKACLTRRPSVRGALEDVPLSLQPTVIWNCSSVEFQLKSSEHFLHLLCWDCWHEISLLFPPWRFPANCHLCFLLSHNLVWLVPLVMDSECQ